jgi:hypothetical protein
MSVTGHISGQRNIGVIAPEVEAVFPALVTTWGEDGYKAVALPDGVYSCLWHDRHLYSLCYTNTWETYSRDKERELCRYNV